MNKRIEQQWLESIYALLSTFAEIPEEEWERLRSALKPLQLHKHEYFIRSGRIPDKMAFILSGIFRVFYLTETGDEKILVFREEGRILSAFSPFLKNESSWYNIQALENADLLYLHLNDYKNILNSHQCWQTVNAKYVEKLFIEKEEREREFLSADAETRYKNFLLKYPAIEERVHQYHIASYLGVTPVTLSRIRKNIRKNSGS
jgi:CRP-like cAMP-binding protein